jgi:hypothetical protein
MKFKFSEAVLCLTSSALLCLPNPSISFSFHHMQRLEGKELPLATQTQKTNFVAFSPQANYTY